MKISVAGAGAFGSSIASVYAKGGHSVKLYSPTNFKELNATRTPKKLGHIKLPKEVDIISSLKKLKKASVYFWQYQHKIWQFFVKIIIPF